MKTKFTLRNATMLSFLAATLFTACSKDKIDVIDNQTNPAAVSSEGNNAGTNNTTASGGKVKIITTSPADSIENDLTYGSVKLTISPSDAVGQIIIFNDDFSYENFVANGSGEFQINNVRTGNYTIVIVPNDDSYKKKEITDVQISESAVSDLGSFTLEN